VVLSPDEVQRVIAQLDGAYRLIALLQYGAGLRLLDCLRLRIKGPGRRNNVIVVRHGKGGKDRRTMFPEAVKPDLRVRSPLDQPGGRPVIDCHSPQPIARPPAA